MTSWQIIHAHVDRKILSTCCIVRMLPYNIMRDRGYQKDLRVDDVMFFFVRRLAEIAASWSCVTSCKVKHQNLRFCNIASGLRAWTTKKPTTKSFPLFNVLHEVIQTNTGAHLQLPIQPHHSPIPQTKSVLFGKKELCNKIANSIGLFTRSSKVCYTTAGHFCTRTIGQARALHGPANLRDVEPGQTGTSRNGAGPHNLKV